MISSHHRSQPALCPFEQAVFGCVARPSAACPVSSHERLFADYKAGLRPDLDDQAQNTLFQIHLETNLKHRPSCYTAGYNQEHKLRELHRLVRAWAIPDRPNWPTISFQHAPMGNQFILRPLPLYEAPFRSYLGGDCGTGTKFGFALEYAYQHFALEQRTGEGKIRPRGQIEVVLEAPGPSPKALFHRIQVPDSRAFTVEEFLSTVNALGTAIESRGYTLVRYRSLKDYSGRGHSISNQLREHVLSCAFYDVAFRRTLPFTAAPFRYDIHRGSIWKRSAERLERGVEVVALRPGVDFEAPEQFKCEARHLRPSGTFHSYQDILKDLHQSL